MTLIWWNRAWLCSRRVLQKTQICSIGPLGPFSGKIRYFQKDIGGLDQSVLVKGSIYSPINHLLDSIPLSRSSRFLPFGHGRWLRAHSMVRLGNCLDLRSRLRLIPTGGVRWFCIKGAHAGAETRASLLSMASTHPLYAGSRSTLGNQSKRKGHPMSLAVS